VKKRKILTFGNVVKPSKVKTAFSASNSFIKLSQVKAERIQFDADMVDIKDPKLAAEIRLSKIKELETKPQNILKDVTIEETEEDTLELFMVHVDKQVKQLATEDRIKSGDQELDSFEKKQLNAILNDEEAFFEAPEEVSLEPTQQDIFEQIQAKLAKKKELLETDHTKVEYEAFRKDFYVEPQEYARVSAKQVDQMRLDLDGIKVRGKNCPKPVERWSQCGLPNKVQEILRKNLKYERPSPIQAQAIPAVTSGRDVIGIAKTGSGKTLAFLLPMFRHIKDQRPLKNMEGPIALIMTPTRELAIQIQKDCRHFIKVLNLRAVCCYGGAPIKDQIAELKRGAEILICTPGRLIDLLCANSGRVTNLKRVTYVVLDEADRMFDLGFEPQVIKIVMNIRPDRQTLLFSATFPKFMESLARKILNKPLEIAVGVRSVVSPDVSQVVEIHVNEESKFLRLLDILGRTAANDITSKTLIFVDRQDAADILMGNLLKKGHPCQSIHGGKDQSDRDQTILDFKAGNISILIATSIAARGLDVKLLNNVINYECPNHIEDYVHRCGRTGRAGNKGIAYTFITPDQDRFAGDIVQALQNSGAHVPFDLKELVLNFEAKKRIGAAVQTGAGFGGRGLAQLEFHREITKKIQKKTHVSEDAEDQISDTEEQAPQFEEDEDINPNSLALLQPTAIESAVLWARERAAMKFKTLSELNQPVMIKTSADSAHSTEIEINEYPIMARFMVTNKEQINRITELSGAAITVRGVYVQPGRQPPFGERRLHLV
jgi:ATP-dependent RNA helicase DDX46/PRP5